MVRHFNNHITNHIPHNSCPMKQKSTSNSLSTQIGQMKDGVLEQYFFDNDAIMAAENKCAACSHADFYKCRMHSLVNHCLKYIAIVGDYVEKHAGIAENLLYLMVLLCSLHLF